MVISFNISNSIIYELYADLTTIAWKILVISITAKIQEISYVDRRTVRECTARLHLILCIVLLLILSAYMYMYM